MLDSTGSISATAPQIFGNDVLSPAGTVYFAKVVNANGQTVWQPNQGVFISGTSFNFNTALPTSAGVILANAVLQNPTGPQTITGFGLTLAASAPLTVNSAATFTGNNTHSGIETFNQLSGCQHVNANQSFAQALAAGGVTCITVDPGTYAVSANATVPTGVGLAFSKGGILSIANAITLTVNSPVYASPDAAIFAYVGSGTVVLGGANAVVSNAWFPGADWCAQTNAALLALQAGSNRGGTIDGRHYLTAQTCAGNPFAGVTMPFQLLVPNANIALNDERAQWLQSSSSQQVFGANPALNPGQIYPTSWPEATLSGSVGVIVTSNVAAVTFASAITRAPIAGSVWCIAGTTDPIVEGCIQVLASPAPTTTTFSYNAPSVSNRTVTGGIASPAMIAYSGSTVQSSFYSNMYISGNSLADFVFANITGQEQTGIRDSTITQYGVSGIFAGGLNTNLGAGPGNNDYSRNIVSTSTAFSKTYTKDIWLNRLPQTRQTIEKTTINGSGGGAGSGAGIFLYDASASIYDIHVESRSSCVQLVAGPGSSTLLGNNLTDGPGSCTTAITADSTGNRINMSNVQAGATNSIVNNFTGTTRTKTLIWYYANTASPKYEGFCEDATNGGCQPLSTTALTLKTGSGAGNYTGVNTTYAAVDTTNICATFTVPTGWKLKIESSGVLESVTAAVAQSIALADAGATCTSGGVTALNGTERAPTPPAAGTFDVNFHTQYVLTGDGNAHSVLLVAKTSAAADAWGIQNTSATVAPSLIYTLMPSN